MGVCNEITRRDTGENRVTIWGDVCDPDTRTCLLACLIAGQTVCFEQIDPHQRVKSIRAKLPPNHGPMLTDGATKVIGTGMSIMTYLIHRKGHERLKKRLYQTELRFAIDREIKWYDKKIKPVTDQLAKAACGTSVVSLEVLEEMKSKFFDKLLPQINSRLTHSFLLGGSLTLCDLYVYCDIRNVLVLTRKAVPGLPHL